MAIDQPIISLASASQNILKISPIFTHPFLFVLALLSIFKSIKSPFYKIIFIEFLLVTINVKAYIFNVKQSLYFQC